MDTEDSEWQRKNINFGFTCKSEEAERSVLGMVNISAARYGVWDPKGEEQTELENILVKFGTAREVKKKTVVT